MAGIDTRELRAWALKGAEQRLVEIAAEAAAIHRAFPELRDRSDLVAPVARGTGRKAAGAPPSAPTGRTGRTMTAAERRAVSERMQRYWAARREASASAPPEPATADAEPIEDSSSERQAGRRKQTAASRGRGAKTRRAGVAMRRGGTKTR